MLVPRSFKYQSSPPTDNMKNKSLRHAVRKSSAIDARSPTRQDSSRQRVNTEPVAIPSPKQPQVANEEGSRCRDSDHMAYRKAATVGGGSRKRSAHDPNAIPPAVAALLAMTTIPPRRPNRYRTRSDHDRHMSIEELVSSWKSDDSLRPSYGSPGLSMLLEDTDEAEDGAESAKDNGEDGHYFNVRTSSSESMPSLEADDRSVLSFGSPSTPESLRSRKSITNLRRDKLRYVPAVEDCPLDHPLVPHLDDDDILQLPVQKQAPGSRAHRTSFKSNLATSLQNLKIAALNSISSFGRTAPPQIHAQKNGSPAFDEVLWSHPFLFPNFSSEVRPAIEGKPSKAQRRYLNPEPLTFEEQERPFQKALHAPYLKADQGADSAPTIQMQTYNRSRRKPSPRRAAPDPNSEAGRALLGADRIRQREVRENSDFLRIVVMEMNMRRVGKLESGRAKIWLPPRDSSPMSETKGRETPRRWIGVSAY